MMRYYCVLGYFYLTHSSSIIACHISDPQQLPPDQNLIEEVSLSHEIIDATRK
jgi:hypothetical protein